jgi:hypothetical protein
MTTLSHKRDPAKASRHTHQWWTAKETFSGGCTYVFLHAGLDGESIHGTLVSSRRLLNVHQGHTEKPPGPFTLCKGTGQWDLPGSQWNEQAKAYIRDASAAKCPATFVARCGVHRPFPRLETVPHVLCCGEGLNRGDRARQVRTVAGTTAGDSIRPRT